jgi:uncharacterized membrane protein YgdD (TMEM256/DUF423 family)
MKSLIPNPHSKIPNPKSEIMKLLLLSGSLFGALAVLLGALGAHALKSRLSPELLGSWETGVRYQMFHALALFAVAWLITRGLPGGIAAGGCFIAGTLMFSGSIYLLCLGIGPRAVLGPITPLGGLTLIAGWLVLLSGVWRGDWT